MALEGFSTEQTNNILSLSRSLRELPIVDSFSDLETDQFNFLEEIRQLIIDTLHINGFLQSEFDWQGWLENQNERIMQDVGQLDYADLDTLRRLITAHIRTDRFVRGHFHNLLLNGYFGSFIARLNQLNR